MRSTPKALRQRSEKRCLSIVDSPSLAEKCTKEEENGNKDENMQSSEPAPAPAPARKQKKKKPEKETSPAPESVPSTSTTKRTAKCKHSKARASSHYTVPEDDDHMELDTPLDSETRPQACGLLIETMPQPALKTQLTEREWVCLFDRVLHAGETGSGGCGVFRKVESSEKDRADQPLEAQWFYVPKMDQDQSRERAALIRAMMPRPAKRSETEKYKQYY